MDIRYYFVELVPAQNYILDLYLINNTLTQNITATIRDENGQLLTDIEVRLLKYYVEDAEYKTVEMSKTDEEGEALLHVKYYDAYYKLYIYKDNTLVHTTDDFYVTKSNYDITVNLLDPVGDHFYKSHGVYHRIFPPNGSADYFKYIWTDSASVMSNTCLETWQRDRTGLTYINQSCSTSASGTMYGFVTNVSGRTYEAKALMFFSDPAEYVEDSTYQYLEDLASGRLGLFLIALITALFALTGTWNLVVASIITPLPIAVGTKMGFINLQPWVGISLVAMGILIAFTLSKKS
jgi:hypothetical protein